MRNPFRRRTFRDPITGDDHSMGEHAAWIAQGFFRRWAVMIAIQAICAVWLLFGNEGARTWWNYVWSDLAIVIENVTMLALFNQTRRDAVVTRDIRKIIQHVEHIVQHHPDIPAVPDTTADPVAQKPPE